MKRKVSILKRGIAFSLFLVYSISGLYSETLENNLATKLKDSGMIIQEKYPLGFLEANIDESIPFKYDYALKSEIHDFEIRYVIHPSIYKQKQYEELKKTSGVVLAPQRENDYLLDFANILINLSDNPENLKKGRDFPPDAVKKEFGADWGNASFLMLNPSYDKKFKMCFIITLYRKNRASAYILYLANDQTVLLDYLKDTKLYYNLRFAN